MRSDITNYTIIIPCLLHCTLHVRTYIIQFKCYLVQLLNEIAQCCLILQFYVCLWQIE